MVNLTKPNQIWFGLTRQERFLARERLANHAVISNDTRYFPTDIDVGYKCRQQAQTCQKKSLVIPYRGEMLIRIWFPLEC